MKLKATTRRPYPLLFCEEILPETIIDTKKYKGLTTKPEQGFIQIYLHGSVEKLAGFDIPTWLEGDFPAIVDGEATCDVSVLLPNREVDCTMYCWTVAEGKNLKGLILDKTDSEWRIEYALKCQKERKGCI